MKKIIHIKGMHCISCELLLDKELKKIDGVELLMLSHKKGIMEINYSDSSVYENVVKIIEKNGFKVIEESKKNKKDFSKILSNLIAILSVTAVFMLARLFDLNNLIHDTSTLSYTSAFLVGIIASLSTCLAITGGIIIGFARYIDSEKSTLGHIKVQLGFQLGRIFGFFILGGILGYLGKMIVINLSFTWIISFIVGALLLYMGLNILGIIPSLTKLGIHMPKSFVSKIEAVGHPKFAPVVGMLTLFLPCGFTQTMQLLAISSGDFVKGGLIMMFFAIGTFPVLFSVGLGSSYFKEKKIDFLNKIIGILVVLFGLITLSNYYNLVSFVDGKTPTDVNIEDIEKKQKNIKQEVISISHNGSSMEPETLELEAGKSYKIIITPTSNGIGCMSTQVLPKISDKVSYIKKGVPIIYEINNASKGTYELVCATMGMHQGTIIVK